MDLSAIIVVVVLTAVSVGSIVGLEISSRRNKAKKAAQEISDRTEGEY